MTKLKEATANHSGQAVVCLLYRKNRNKKRLLAKIATAVLFLDAFSVSLHMFPPLPHKTIQMCKKVGLWVGCSQSNAMVSLVVMPCLYAHRDSNLIELSPRDLCDQ